MPRPLLAVVQHVLQQPGKNPVAVTAAQPTCFSHIFGSESAGRTFIRNRRSRRGNQKGFRRNLFDLILHGGRGILLALAGRKLRNCRPHVKIDQILLGKLWDTFLTNVDIDRFGVHQLAQMTSRLVAWTESALHN